MSLIYGFGGMRDFDGKLSFDPRLPKEWEHLQFPLRFHESRIEVEITHSEMIVTLLDGPELPIEIRGTQYVAKDEDPLMVSLA
jgi:alpha,alpha-trehalose phosphorylase